MQIFLSYVLKIIDENGTEFLIRYRKNSDDFLVIDQDSLDFFVMADIELMEFFENINNHHLNKIRY
jgi:hypothetical protein